MSGFSAEETDAYEQIALYIQEGFRIYGIDEAYQAYFGPIEEEEEPLSEYDSYFYLTEDGLGIITFAGRYYNCLEASFEDLGIEGITCLDI